MATHKDSNPTQNSWIHDLARAEVHPEAEKLLGLMGNSLDPHQLVEECTVSFLMELREKFNEFARVFNSYSEAGGRFHEVKVYAVAQTAADFMVFRNQTKLVITNSAHGVITIAFAAHTRSPFAFDGANPDGIQPQAQELLAQVGPFKDAKWTFQGEKVEPEQVARYYFAEFVRTTREKKTSRNSNQALLDQIKSLLQEKGIDL